MPRLLVADDDREFVRKLVESLQGAFDVELVENVEQILPCLMRDPFDAVLICVEIGGNQGYAIGSRIRKEMSLAGTKLAFISSRATPEEFARHLSLKDRADLYLSKHISSEQMRDCLCRFMSNSVVGPVVVEELSREERFKRLQAMDRAYGFVDAPEAGWFLRLKRWFSGRNAE